VAVSLVFLIFREVVFDRVLHLAVNRSLLVSASLLASAFLWQAALLFHKPLELLLKPGLMLWAILVALAVNAAGNILFIPAFGFVAAAVTSLASVLTYKLIIFAILLHFNRKGSFRS
jgi:O-antigen/teichoic acid export membrane protein